MSWGIITEDWRMKLLALGLAVLMLGAVAFSQNPPTTGHLTVGLNYAVRPNIVLINPPSKITVTYSGLADAIAQVNQFNLIASVDATQALPGSAVKLNVNARTLLPSGSVTVQQPGPIAVTIDSQQTVSVPLNVVAPTVAGWSVTKAVALCPTNPCATVSFTGPVSWENNLTATATFPSTIGQDTSGCTALACAKDSPNQPIVLRNSSGVLDLYSPRNQTVPVSTLDITNVSLHVEAVTGVTSSTVPLVIGTPAQPPPQGYSITGISITPPQVVVTGDQTVLGRMQRITLPGQDLSKSTSDATFQIAIPYPKGTTGSAAIATVVYSISRNPQVSPSPGG
jgi:YbbR domain-containing protein